MTKVCAVVHVGHYFKFDTDRPWDEMDIRERLRAVMAEAGERFGTGTEGRDLMCVESFHALSLEERDHPETTWVRGTEEPWCASGFALREDSVRATLSRDLDGQMRFDKWGSYGDRLGVVGAVYERCLHTEQVIQAAVNSGRMSVRDIEALEDLRGAVQRYMARYADVI